MVREGLSSSICGISSRSGADISLRLRNRRRPGLLDVGIPVGPCLTTVRSARRRRSNVVDLTRSVFVRGHRLDRLPDIWTGGMSAWTGARSLADLEDVQISPRPARPARAGRGPGLGDAWRTEFAGSHIAGAVHDGRLAGGCCRSCEPANRSPSSAAAASPTGEDRGQCARARRLHGHH